MLNISCLYLCVRAVRIANNVVGNFTYLQSFDLRKNVRDVVIRKFHLHG